MMLLPAALSAAVLAVVGLVSNMGNMLLFSLPMTLVAALSSVTVSLYRKRARERRNAEQRQAYLQRLQEIRQHLAEAVETQRSVWLEENPSPGALSTWVRDRTRNLWARKPTDDDFLSLRLGLGTRRSLVRVTLPDPGLVASELHTQARSLVDSHAFIAQVPICAPLREAGIAGIAGPPRERMAMVNALLMQLAVCHAPTEVKLAVIVGEADSPQWSGMRWLPHIWDAEGRRRYIATGEGEAHALLLDLADIVARRQARKQADGAPPPLPAFVVLVADGEVMRHDASLQRLMLDGPANGIYIVFVGERVSEMPNAIRLGVRLGSDGGSQPFVSDFAAQTSTSFVADALSSADAERLARQMAAIRLVEPAGEGAIPPMATLLSLFDADTLDDLQIAARWQQNQRASRTLAVPIGLGQGGEKLLFDLHERVHGPNGLVAGMVGTGKSELLQTLVAALAINFSPERVAFVVVDYKGGGMADPFRDMAHSAGVITNLQDPGLARRAITSLNIEARYRQGLFEAVGVNHIDDYQRRFYAGELSEPLPYLVLIVDEFAEMKADQPDTAAEFVRLARIGRSLGFRIILAMQKPAGIVDAQIEGNTRFRLCLRVAQPEDSQSMLRRADAAFLQGIGRAIFQVGVNEVFREFQVGYSGAPYRPGVPERDPRRVDLVHAGGQRELLYAPQVAERAQGVSQLEAVVAAVRDAALASGVRQARQLWVDPLPERISAADWSPEWAWTGDGWQDGSRPLRALVGTRDVPERQTREPLVVDLSGQPHLGLLGAPGVGKTSFLRALLLALVRDHAPDRLAVYVLAFGGGALRAFERLPHVGAVVTGDQTERVGRLVRWVRQELRRRQALLAQHSAASVADYVQRTGQALPEVLFIVDGYATFASDWEDDAEVLVNVAREGASVGVHLVVTANSSTAIPFRIRSSLTNLLTLQLADETEYSAVVGRTEGLSPGQTPGRGLEPGRPPHLFQTAWYDLDDAPGGELDRLCASMDRAWRGWRPTSVETLPELVTVRDVLARADADVAPGDPIAAVALGLQRDDLQPFTLDLSATVALAVIGTPHSGKTNVLAALCQSLGTCCAPDQVALYVCDTLWQDLSWVQRLPHTRAYSHAAEEATIITRGLATLLSRRRDLARQGSDAAESGDDSELAASQAQHHVLLVDGLFEPTGEAIGAEARQSITEVLRSGRPLGVHVVLAADVNAFARGYDDLSEALKALQHGLVLGTVDPMPLRFRLPSGGYDRPMGAGEAYYVNRGRMCHLQLALAEPGELEQRPWL
jgi:S-DNA-T family DNA segregation ATPase FtsK/SpoIIIE